MPYQVLTKNCEYMILKGEALKNYRGSDLEWFSDGTDDEDHYDLYGWPDIEKKEEDDESDDDEI